MSPDSLGVLILWVVTLTWLLINTLALKDAIFEYHDEKQDNGFADKYGTKEQIYIARKRLRQAGWFVLGFSMMELIGLSATLRLILYPPPPDNSLYSNFSRVVIILGVFGFWRAKRIARILRRGFRNLFMPQGPQGQGQGLGQESQDRVPAGNLTRKAEHIEQLAEDTNYKVNSINQKISPATHEEQEREREDKE